MDSKTIKKLVTIILLIAVISYTLDKLVFFGLNKISDNVMTGQAIGKLNQFLSEKDSLDFIVFGNSRANHHIDVDLFNSNSYNIGVDGTGIAYSSTLINTLSKDRKQLILVHVDTKNFFDSIYEGEDIRSLKSKYQRNEIITKALNKSGQLSTLHRAYYSMNYNGSPVGIIKNYFKPSYNYKTYNGYDPLEINESQEEMRSIIFSNSLSNECMPSYEINSKALEYLKSIKSYIETSKNKTFLFVTSPIYDDNCNKDNVKLAAIMKELNFTYWDFSNFFKDTKDISNWKDLTHMSKKGAESFSKHLLEKYSAYQD